MGRGRIAVGQEFAPRAFGLSGERCRWFYRECGNVGKSRASTRKPEWCRFPQLLFMEAVVGLRETDCRKVVIADAGSQLGNR